MTGALLHRDQVISVRNELARVLSLLPDGETWQIETLHDRVIHRYQDSEIRRLYVDGQVDLDPVRDDKVGKAVTALQSKEFETYSKNQRREAKRRHHFVKAALAADYASLVDSDLKKVIREAATNGYEQCLPSAGTVRKWAAYYLSGRHDIRSLIPSWHRRGDRNSRQYILRNGKRLAIPAHDSDELLGEALREYLRRERPRGTACFRYVKSYFAKANAERSLERQAKVPSRATVFRRLSAMDPYEKAYYRYGKARADALMKLKADGPGATFPLERVEMDATRLDVFVVAPNSGLVIGRPWITVAIDYYSRAVLGFYLGFEPPSATTVMHCLRHAIAPKDHYVEKFGSEAFRWPMHGVPLMIVVDNAQEYQSETVEDAALQLGFDIQQHPVKWPHWKGTIERFFRTLNDSALVWLPGKSFRNIVEKGDYDAEWVAVIELPELERLITKWIIVEYNTTRHEGIRDVPDRMWTEGVKKAPPALPPRVSDLDILLSYTKTVVLTAKGIQFQNLIYRSEELHALFMRNGQPMPVKIKVDDRDISLIRVLDSASGKYIPVPVQGKHADYAKGLSLAEHFAVQNYRRKVADSAESRPELLDARNRLAEEMADLLGNKRTRSRDRLRAARINANKLRDSRAVRGAFDPFESERAISDSLLDEEPDCTTIAVDDSDEESGKIENRLSSRTNKDEAATVSVASDQEDQAGRTRKDTATSEKLDGYVKFRASNKLTVRKRPARDK